MPILIGSIIGGLLQVLGTVVGRVLISLGIGYVTFSGVDTSLTWARDYTFDKLAGMPAVALQVASTLRVGTCVSMLVSALVVRLLIAGMTGGALSRFVVKG